jgi:hypothetical protein
MAEISLGTYLYEKETPGTFRYQREDENGRKQTIYVPKSKMETKVDSFEVILRTA